MEWQVAWTDPFTAYLSTFYGLIGDLRTQVTFTEIVRGIISAGSLVCQRIAAQSAVLMAVKDGAQRLVLSPLAKRTTRCAPSLTAISTADW
ncbi:MAG: hypothetical protein NUW23_16350, partial [Firmicutes bacterium]|nr:hypothetical protein [Bacillota bacterium]